MRIPLPADLSGSILGKKMGLVGCKGKKTVKGMACLGKVVTSVLRLLGCRGVRKIKEQKNKPGVMGVLCFTFEFLKGRVGCEVT